MINKRIIDNYLNRKLDNWDWLKDGNEDDLTTEIKNYFPEFNPRIKPFKHQLICILLGIFNPEFNFFLDMGLGKTFIILNLIQYWNKKTLVLVPNEVNVLSWKKEISKFTDFNSIGISGSSKKKEELLQQESNIYICNYMGFLRLFTIKIGKKTDINFKKVNNLLEQFDIIIFDEIHKLGNKKSLTSKLCNMIPAKIRYGLTGTPFGKSPLSLWNEFKVIDNGATLGETDNFFKEVFFTKSFNYFGQLEFNFKNRLSDTLNETIKNASITYSSAECIDLPKLTKQTIKISLEKEGRKYYNKSFDELVELLKDGQTAIENSFVRLRAVCAGFLYFKNEENKKVKIDFNKNPKLDHLIELVDNIEGKLLIFNEYTFTGDIIENRLKKEKVKYSRLYGGTKNKQKAIKDFTDDCNIKVFLLNSESGGTGTNLQFCNYAIFYETSVKPITRKQCEKRIYRIGQEKHTFIYDLVIVNSIEEKILDAIEQGKNLYDSIMKERKL